MAKGKINHWIDRFNRLDDFGKIAVLSTVLIVLILILVMFKQGTFLIGRTGSSGMFMPFLHHSRIGIIMASVGSFLMLKNKNKRVRTVALFLVVIGLFLVVQHLATEQCFTLLTSRGTPAGGFC